MIHRPDRTGPFRSEIFLGRVSFRPDLRIYNTLFIETLFLTLLCFYDLDEAAESGSLNDAIVEFLEETVANDSDDFFDKAVETIVVNESTQGNLEDLPQPVFMEIKNISDEISVSKLCTQSFTIILNF